MPESAAHPYAAGAESGKIVVLFIAVLWAGALAALDALDAWATTLESRYLLPVDPVDGHELDFEDQRRVGRDDRRPTLRAVGHGRRNRELSLLADLHARDSLVPPFDDLTLAERELKGLIPVARAVELLSVGQGADIVNADLVARLRHGAFARGECHCA